LPLLVFRDDGSSQAVAYPSSRGSCGSRKQRRRVGEDQKAWHGDPPVILPGAQEKPPKMARALLLAAALVACHCTAQAQRAPPGGSDVPSCDDTCQCSEQEGCGANNGVCDEAVAVSSQINEGSYDKSRGCVAGHCCTDGTDGSDCIAAGHPCRLTQSAPGPSTTSGPPVPPAPAPPETQNTGPITRYIVYAYLMVGWLYLKGKLPAVEGEVTERQVEQARRKHMGTQLPASNSLPPSRLLLS